MSLRTFEEVAKATYGTIDRYWEHSGVPNANDQVEFLRAARRNGHKLAAHEEALLAKDSKKKAAKQACRPAPSNPYDEYDQFAPITYEQLTKILVDKGVYHKFTANIDALRPHRSVNIDEVASLNAHISMAFPWEATPEGYEYWHGIATMEVENETKTKDKTMTTDKPKVGTIITDTAAPSYSDYDIVVGYRSTDTSRYPLQGLKDIYNVSDLKPITIEGHEVSIKVTLTSNIEVRVDSLEIAIPIGVEGNLTKDMPKSTFNRTMKNVIVKATEAIKKRADEIKNKTTRQLELEKLATTYKPVTSTTIIEEIDDFSIEVPEDLSLQDKYTTVVGNMNEIVANINDSNSLDSQKELAEAFVKVRSELTKFTNKEPGKMSALATKYLGKSNWLSKKIDNAKDTIAENASVKSNIDYIFGLMHEKYNKLVEVAEGLQKSRATLQAQLEALTELADESDKDLAGYKDQSEIPTRELGLNTQIKASVEKYRDRIAKVKGAVTAMQATIIALGRDLPAHKSDLEDEMALSGLLTNIDDYQKMFGEVKNLVVEVTASTREQTHEVVDNLMKMQIEDTHTMEAIANNLESGKQFTKMLAENTQKLADKTV